MFYNSRFFVLAITLLTAAPASSSGADVPALPGVQLSIESSTEILANLAGGERRGAVPAGLLSFGLDAALEPLAGWRGGHFHASAHLPLGSNISERYIGDLGIASNIAFTNTLRLFELWIEQRWFDERLSLRAGILAFDEEFAGSDLSGCFINAGFGPSVAITANMPVPVYAIAAPGVRLSAIPLRTSLHEVLLLAAIYDGNPAPGALPDRSPGAAPSTESNHFGTHWALRADEGALLAFEAAWSRKADEDEESPSTMAKAGVVLHTDRFADQADPDRSRKGNRAVYGLIEQELWRDPAAPARRLAAFARGTWAPDRWNAIQFAGETGLVLRAPLPGRDEDAMALGLAHFRSSDSLRHAAREAGEAAPGHETVVELTYHCQAAPWLVIQPDVQVIFHPGGARELDPAIVAGLRVSASF
jgi:porin